MKKIGNYHILRFAILMLFAPPFLQAQKGPSKKLLKEEAPPEFVAKIETTKGVFMVFAKREWAPLGVDRFYQLIKSGFFTDVAIFRVQPGYVAQFGISDKQLLNEAWEENELPDETVSNSNLKGTIAFARGGPNTRTTQLFINLADNQKLDTISFQGLRGFPPIAKVTSGMDVVESFYGGYGFEPVEKQDGIYENGNAYLKENYPDLDYILKATIVEE